ncbi:MAG: sulfotransferase, partial [Cyanobacteria bacterium J06592_8]
MNFKNNPVVIGAVGGSGTRIFTKIIRYAGIYMGSDLNKAEENNDNKSFYRAWLPLYLHKNGCLPESVHEALSNDFHDFIKNHLAEIPSEDARWGLKHPNNLLMIKFWNEIFPQMKFLHVVRNGLDMVYSMKRIQYQTYQWFFLDKEEQDKGSTSQILFWSTVNQ